MATKDVINGIVAAVKSLTRENIAALGGSEASQIVEDDEEPTYLERAGYVLPVFFVLPLAEGDDKITTHMSGGIQDHEFPLTVVGFYKTQTIAEGIQATRDYGYNFVDLVAGKHLVGPGFGGYLLDPVLSVARWRVVDYIIHAWIVKLTIKTKGGV